MKKDILVGVSLTAVVSGVSLAGILFYLAPGTGLGLMFLFYANLFLFLFSCFAFCGFAYGALFLKSGSESYRFAVLRRAFLLAFLFIASLFLQKMKLFGYLAAASLLFAVLVVEAYASSILNYGGKN